MINLDNEQLLTLKDAAARLPRRRAGRPTHRATLYRWCTVGYRAVRLECIRVGGTLCTSIEALQRFFDRLAKDASGR